MAACDCKCFDMALVEEYCSTCSEYMRFVFRPFSDVKPMQLLKCSQPSWDQAFKEWTVLELYFGVLVAILVTVSYLVLGEAVDPQTGELASSASGSVGAASAAMAGVIGILQAYFAAHMAWFGGVRKHGCCWCLCCCFEGHLVLLLWTALLICGVANEAYAAYGEALLGEYHIAVCVLRLIYVVILCYQAMCLVHIYRESASSRSLASGAAAEVGAPKTVLGQPDAAKAPKEPETGATGEPVIV